MSEGLILVGNALRLRSQDQRRNPVAFLANGFQNLGKSLRIVGLREKEVGRVGCQLFGDIAVRGTFQEDVAAVTNKILLQKTGNEVLFDIKDRLHEIKMHLQT